MPEHIYYNSEFVRLGWGYWSPEPPADAGALPATHVQEVLTDPEVIMERYALGLARATAACGKVLQYGYRVALPAETVEDLRVRAGKRGLELQLGPAEIKAGQAVLHLGYLRLRNGPAFRQGSNIQTGLKEGHCLLDVTAVTVSSEVSLPEGARERAGVDSLFVHQEPMIWQSWGYGSRRQPQIALE